MRTKRVLLRQDGTFSESSKEECFERRWGAGALSPHNQESGKLEGAAADPVRKGIAVHLGDLRGFARYLTRDVAAADDLVQDTVLRALGARHQFQEGTNIKAWLFTILRNVFLEQRRRKAKETEILSGISRESDEMSDRGAALQDHVLDLSVLLWRLPQVLREALILVGAQELSYEEAAAICDCPVGTMKARVSRARAKLAELASSVPSTPMTES
nr:sigma-70 family RNA polymerase sigma factor [Asaia krungthepensis]